MLLIFPHYFSDSIKTSVFGILLLALSKFSYVLPLLISTHFVDLFMVMMDFG